MSLTRHIEPEDLALFAMQLLGKDEARAVATHMEECPECRQQLAEVQGDLAVYAHAVDTHSPPALARERLMKQVAREKKVVPIERVPVRPAPVEATYAPRQESAYRTGLGSGAYLSEEEPQRSVASKALPWLGWAVAAGIAVAAGSLYHDRDALQARLKSQTSQMDRISADAAAAKHLLDAMSDPTARHVTLVKAPATSTPPQPQGRATYVSEKGALIFLASNLEPLQP